MLPPRGEQTVCIPLTRLKPVRGWHFTARDVVLYAAGVAVWTATLLVIAYSLAGFFGGGR